MKKKVMHPLLSWDIISDRWLTRVEEKDLQTLVALKKRYQWKADVEVLLKSRFDAIVVTDKEERIIWASRGFERMTGYAPSFAKKKKPSFLQGRNTGVHTKQRIRQALERRRPVAGTLINYRKDGSEYLCRVDIIPLYNLKDTFTHFIAFEMEVE
jgi:PAS domain S-box-containing protein